MAIQRQWRWKSDIFVEHVGATREENYKVSTVLASSAVAKGVQPRLDTRRGGGRVGNNSYCGV